MEDGFGLVFLCDAAIDEDLEKWIARTLAAAFEGTELPAAPASARPRQPHPHEYAGAFRLAGTNPSGARGATLEFVAIEDHLFLKGERGNISLQRMGRTCFVRPAMQRASFPSCSAATGRRERARSPASPRGAQWYAAEGFSGPTEPSAPKEYGSYVGHFVNNGPEGPVARVFVRNGRLMMLLSEDEDATPDRSSPWGSGLFRIGKAEYSPERARFDTVIDGEALRLFVSGVPLYRKDIP